LAKVGLKAASVDRCVTAVDGECSHEVALEQLSKNGISLTEQALERVEEPRRLGDSAVREETNDMCAKGGEKFGVVWWLAEWVRTTVRFPLRGERRERACERGLEERARHVLAGQRVA
jgi:hypothetical protein